MAVLAAGVVPAANAVGVPGQGTWETTLQGRDLDGVATTFEAYYDTALDITWLADANYAKTSGYDADGYSRFISWDDAKIWAANLNVNGTTGWRLPILVDTGCDYSNAGGTDCGYNVQTKDASTGKVYSEMAYMYYVTLGNRAICTPGDASCSTFQNGWGLKNTGPFKNLLATYYWTIAESSLENAPITFYNPSSFNTGTGGQYGIDPYGEFSAWAVRSGDVVSVPEPATYALMGMGLAALAFARKLRPA